MERSNYKNRATSKINSTRRDKLIDLNIIKPPQLVEELFSQKRGIFIISERRLIIFTLVNLSHRVIFI